MTRLSDTQLVILGAAAQRADLAILPLPDSLKLKGGALTKVMDSLRNRGLIRVVGAEGGPQRVVITSEGMGAIGVEHEETGATGDNAALDDYPTHGTPADQGAWAARQDDMARDREADAPPPNTAPTTAEADSVSDAPANATGAAGAAARKPARGKGKAKAKVTKAAPNGQPTAKPTPRAGTKQALMIELLKRPEGATVEQIAAATGWQHHTIRGAISGALKKKLGLTVEATRTREVGPNKAGAKGSTTVYRIVE
jgi:Protein of unknown function (DUF3489)